MSTRADVERSALARAIRAQFDRRRFLVAAGAVAGVAIAPPAALSAGIVPAGQALLDDWTIDDMWGVFPRYAESIGFAGRAGKPPAPAAPADAPWCD